MYPTLIEKQIKVLFQVDKPEIVILLLFDKTLESNVKCGVLQQLVTPFSAMDYQKQLKSMIME